MPDEQSKRGVWPTIFAGVVLLAVIYGMAYRYSLHHFEMALEDIVAAQRTPVPVVRQPKYSYPGLEGVFAPAHWVDRTLIRPRYWTRDP